MGHPKRVSLDMTPEQASVLNTALEYYKLWLESHPEQKELRKDIPIVDEMQKEVKPIAAQSLSEELDRFVWYGRTR